MPTNQFTNFQSQVSYVFGNFDGGEGGTTVDTTFALTDTYYDLLMEGTNRISSDTINVDFDAKNIVFSAIGKYLVQFIYTFTGGASIEYTMKASLNGIDIEASELTFSTRGTNVQWEVANTFMIDCAYLQPDSNRQNITGLFSSRNVLKFLVKNNNGLNALKMTNLLYNIIKID